MGRAMYSPFRLVCVYAVITYLIGGAMCLAFFQSVSIAWYTMLVGLALGGSMVLLGVGRWTFSILDGDYHKRVPLMNSPTKIGGLLCVIMLVNLSGLAALHWHRNNSTETDNPPRTINVENTLHVMDNSTKTIRD